MVFGICTLSIFGIRCKTSKTECTDYYDNRYREWKTTYYDDNKIECGTSISKEIDDYIGSYKCWETVYYDSNGYECGNSKSIGNSSCPGVIGCNKYKNYDTLETKYYNSNSNECCGTSKSEGINYHDSVYKKWKTNFYESNGKQYANSMSYETNRHMNVFRKLLSWFFQSNKNNVIRTDTECGNVYWKTTYSLYSNEQIELVNNMHKLKPTTKIYPDILLEPYPTIAELRKYYLSQARYFNASEVIFGDAHLKSCSRYKREQIISTLQNRAIENPKGASDKTCIHFRLF
jgi:hypothetical protein